MLKVFSTIVSLALVLLCLGCGDTYDLQSLQISPASPNVVGIGGSQQFKVLATYSNGKTQDVTTRATYVVVPPNAPVLAPMSAIRMDIGGRIQLVDAACTWTATGTAPNKVYGTNPYILTATFSSKNALAFVSASSLAGCDSPDTPINGGSTAPVVINVPEQYRQFVR